MALADETGEIQQFDIGRGGQHDTKACNTIVPLIPSGATLTADKGFDDKKLRRKLRYRGVKPLIPKRQRKKGPRRRTPKPHIYKSRWIIEQGFSRYDQFRRLTVRYERDHWRYKAWWYIASAMIPLQKLTG